MTNKNRKRSMKTITVIMAAVTALIWIILLFIKYIFWGLGAAELWNDIISNVLGILPPIIIFNFAYEYFTKQHMADEMSEQITQTLMSNLEAINLFDTKNKLRFIHTTMTSIVGEESADMVNGLVDPYLTNRYNIRNFFKYTITLRDYRGSEIFGEDRYIRVYENLKYKKRFLASGGVPNEFHIGFFAKNYQLDRALRNQTFLFRENFILDETETEKLLRMPEQEQRSFVEREMSLCVYIDDCKCEISSLKFTENGIDVTFLSSHSESNTANIEISFNMPQKKGHSEFLVSISEPTYSPMIQMSYPEDSMRVNAFTFMNDGDDSLIETATHYAGGYEFCIQDKWIYPISGIAFVIDDI